MQHEVSKVRSFRYHFANINISIYIAFISNGNYCILPDVGRTLILLTLVDYFRISTDCSELN